MNSGEIGADFKLPERRCPMVKCKSFYSHRITFLFSTLILLVSVLLPFSSHASIRTIEGTVISVSDGDTFKVETSEGTKK
jgi:endonuclease YncB( thermonuclease family)